MQGRIGQQPIKGPPRAKQEAGEEGQACIPMESYKYLNNMGAGVRVALEVRNRVERPISNFISQKH
jgi:hypothetical protein